MLRRLFNRIRGKTSANLPDIWDEALAVDFDRAKTPDDTTLYVIGDIHGRADLLNALLEKLRFDAEKRGGRRILVYLGDYVDRGPDSRGVIDTILRPLGTAFEVEALLGNHERAMLDFLDDPERAANWLKYGGVETLLSYGVRPAPGVFTPEKLQAARDEFRDALPRSHLDFLNVLRPSYVLGDFMCVHAGISPARTLVDQQEKDLLWIREPFLSCDILYDKVIVHGHTIVDQPDIRRNRVNLDTGAYYSGRLTCLVVQDDQKGLLFAR